MEVSGFKKGGEKGKGVLVHLNCFPCETDGTKNQAHGFCQECQHYLCKSCYDVHKVPFPSRHHTLLDARAMPKSRPKTNKQSTNQAATLTCDRHTDKAVEIYCTSHMAAVCGVCAHKHHGRPCDTEVINEASEDYRQTAEYVDIKASVKKYKNATTTMETNIDTSIKEVEKSADKTIQNIITHRDKLVAKIQNLSKEAVQVVQGMQKADTDSLNVVQMELSTVQTEIDTIDASLTKYEQNNADLFVKTKQASVFFKSLQERLEKASKQIKPLKYHFKAHGILNKTISSMKTLGATERLDQQPIPIVIPALSLESRQEKMRQAHSTQRISSVVPSVDFSSAQLKHLARINVKASEDKKLYCNITSIALLSPDRLLAVDHYNFSIKCVDIVNKAITSYLKLSSNPWEVTILPPDKAVVTLPSKNQLQVISTKPSLSLDQTINVTGKCYGTGSSRDKLVIGYYEPPKVEVMDLRGTVITIISTDKHGQPMFKYPHYITVRSENSIDMIYVSDCQARTVTKMTMTGQIIFTYSDHGMFTPFGLAVESGGQLLVCDWTNNHILLLFSTGEKIKTLLNRNDGLNGPQAVCVCDVNNKVYVSNYDAKSINVYEMK